MKDEQEILIRFMRKHEYTKSLGEPCCNTNNHHELAPFLAEYGTDEWGRQYSFEVSKFNYTSWYTKKLEEYLTSKPLCIYNLSNHEIQLLEELGKIAVLKDVSRMRDNEDYQSLIDNVKKQFDPCGKNLFVRMSDCSPKDVEGFLDNPCKTIEECINYILRSKRCLVRSFITDILSCSEFNITLTDQQEQQEQQEEKQDVDLVENSAIIFLPWNDDLQFKREFRCFVANDKVVAISQYYWSDDFGYENVAVPILQKMARDICDFWKHLRNEKVISFDECVMDVYVEGSLDDEEDFQISVVEFNPPKAYLSSGSALFHWIYDHAILCGQFENVEFRLVGNKINDIVE